MSLSKNKLIGSSFELITKRYPFNKNSLEYLTKKVIKGSAGTRGEIAMPAQAHSAIKTKEVREVIKWILTNNSNPDITFYSGIDGAFRTKEKPAKETGKEVLILTASFIDDGEKTSAKNKKFAQQSILLKAAN